jgi:hypothetical protein
MRIVSELKSLGPSELAKLRRGPVALAKLNRSEAAARLILCRILKQMKTLRK